MSDLSRMRPSETSDGPNAKLNRPHEVFEHPAEVVADPSLAKNEKLGALGALEQDARQLATASGEGMSGGEETNLREILVARNAIEAAPSDAAFAAVFQTLESELAGTEGTDVHAVIAHAIEAIHAARDAIDRKAGTPVLPPGAAKPGSTQELEEELTKEKLDP